MYKKSASSIVLCPMTHALLSLLCFITAVYGNGYFSDGIGDILNVVQNTLGDIQNYVGERDGCIFTCPNGSKPKRNLRHIASSNGCGAFGYQLDQYLSNEELTECCHEHDFCYDTCNKSKKACDNSFKECMNKLCRKMKKVVPKDVYEGCKSGADMMYAATVALGCKPYKDSQEKACLCEPSQKPLREL
uniref:Phospholipase A2 domain-containing protein n=1 Tax=Arion vulgaris TaxID=1028688 RepID=A0A0B6Y7T9_9EUPU